MPHIVSLVYSANELYGAEECGGVSHVAHAWLVPVRRVSPVNHVSHVLLV